MTGNHIQELKMPAGCPMGYRIMTSWSMIEGVLSGTPSELAVLLFYSYKVPSLLIAAPQAASTSGFREGPPVSPGGAGEGHACSHACSLSRPALERYKVKTMDLLLLSVTPLRISWLGWLPLLS